MMGEVDEARLEPFALLLTVFTEGDAVGIDDGGDPHLFSLSCSGSRSSTLVQMSSITPASMCRRAARS